MNKYLMMSAAALFASTAAAQAAQLSGKHTRDFVFGSSGGKPYCDGGTGAWSSIIYEWRHTNADCNGASYTDGPGIVGKTKGLGDNVFTLDNAYADSSYTCGFDLPAKYKIGGTWRLYCTISGTTTFLANSGTLLAPDPARPNGDGKSLASLVKAMIAEHRAQKGLSR